MKAFFLVFLLLYLSLFPSASPIPLVEIIEEELVVHSTEVVTIIHPSLPRVVVAEFAEAPTLSPQSKPGLLLRPPRA